MDTERKPKTVGCNDEEKLRYATFLISGPAANWWENQLALNTPEEIFTWEEFKQKFRDYHVPESIMEFKRREFKDLRENDETVMKYISKFSQLSRYAVDEVNTEEKCKRRFLEGLNPYMKMKIRGATTQSFQDCLM